MHKIENYSMMISILNFLSKPFYKNFSLFVSIFILISFNLITCLDDFKYWICLVAQGIMDSYILVLIYTLLPKYFKKAYLWIIMAVIVVFSIIDLFTIVTFNRRFDLDVAYVILGTNLKETLEFLLEFVTIKIILLLLLVAFLAILSYHLFYNKLNLTLKTSKLFLLVVLCCIPLNIMVTNPWNGSLFGKIYNLTLVANVPNLKDYYSHPNLEKVSRSPKNIVVIFGESFSKKHSSLYAYGKNTNPYLSILQKDSSLLIFNNVKSPALHTIQSFKAMMSTYKHSYADSCKWYECTTIPEVARLASYSTYWYSNQSQKGLYENIVGEYAKLCDSILFVGDKFAGNLKKDLDGELLLPIKSVRKDSLNLFFIHLMGSHPVFEERYPDHFNRYKEDEYNEYPINQRHNLATYDNSVLYNDSVVYQIMSSFENEESIVFYFSDHSLDIYDSADDYCSHANPNDSVSKEAGSNIPFMVYFSESYKSNFPKHIDSLKENINKTYCTDNIIYTIMDIMGVKFENNEDVEKFSLLNKNLD